MISDLCTTVPSVSILVRLTQSVRPAHTDCCRHNILMCRQLRDSRRCQHQYAYKQLRQDAALTPLVANEQGSFTTPSFVSFTSEERLIGEAAKNQAALNPANTVFDVK